MLAQRVVLHDTLAVVPKYGNSNLDSEFLETMSEDKADQYFSENSELMGTPCKWLDRDQLTTEATCKVHIQRGDECRNYPEAFKKDQSGAFRFRSIDDTVNHITNSGKAENRVEG